MITRAPQPHVERPITTVWRDDAIIAVDKPPGLIVHRGWANDRDVLMTRVRDAIGARVYPVHRLDRGASGIVVFALSSTDARALCEAFAQRRVGKRYVAIVRGHPPDTATIDHPIPRRDGGPRVDARTEIRRLTQHGRYAVVEAQPLTGRLHQIRRHLKHIACPLIGDVRYGKGEHNRLFRTRYDLHRLALHARRMTLPHPRTGTPIELECPMSGALARTIEALCTVDGGA